MPAGGLTFDSKGLGSRASGFGVQGLGRVRLFGSWDGGDQQLVAEGFGSCSARPGTCELRVYGFGVRG